MANNRERVVYTAIFGDYDRVAKIDRNWNCDFICFTDNPDLVSDGWQIIKVELNGLTPNDANRKYKMLPHLYLPEYKSSMYIDGNIILLRDPTNLFQTYLAQSKIAVPKHPERDCLYAEAKFLLDRRKFSESVLSKQIAMYKEQGFPQKWGLTENNIILRSHMSPGVLQLMEQWWDEYRRGVHRDQISLPFLLWKNGVKTVYIAEGPRQNRDFFRIQPHLKNQPKSWIEKLAWKARVERHLNLGYWVLSQILSASRTVRHFAKSLFNHP